MGTICSNTDSELLPADQEGNRLIEMVKDSFLTQVVTQLTMENKLLDLVMVSDPDLIRCENIYFFVGITI